MIVLLCRNRVTDFSTWKTVLDSHFSAHRDAGLRLRDLWRDVEKPNIVFFVFEVASLDKARSFVGEIAAAGARQNSGVLESEYHLLESSPRY